MFEGQALSRVGTETCSTRDNTSLGQQPITIAVTQSTPILPVLLTTLRQDEDDRHYKKETTVKLAVHPALHILITVIKAKVTFLVSGHTHSLQNASSFLFTSQLLSFY